MNSQITQEQQDEDDPLTMAVKSTFNSMQEFQDLAAPKAVCVQPVIAELQVERSITDIRHACVNLADEANLPAQSVHVPDCLSVPNSPPIEAEVSSQQVEAQVETELNGKENLDDAQRAAFTQECGSEPIMSQDAYQITPQLYEGTFLFKTVYLLISTDINSIIINTKLLCSDIMHGISLMTVKETEGVVDTLAQSDRYKKQT